jgi:UDP-N-acetylglucosamine transferase subunit ALG13
VRQILDLEPAWSQHDYFFVTEDTALGRSLAETHRTHFVPHYAAGQARMGAAFKMLASALDNFIRSAAIILRERPDVVVTTGAGAVFFCMLWGRLTGARVVAIESFARFDRPSLFARLAFPLAHDTVVQSALLADRWPKAKVFDPLLMLDAERPKKAALLFATVGATLPFDRMVAAVAGLKAAGDLPEDVIIQTGVGGLKPAGMQTFETMGFEEIQTLLRKADFVVCHGGTGSLITALRQGCHVIAMPRLSRLGEHYDDHQSEITEAFAARGLIQVARTQDELARAVVAARKRPAVMATTAPDALIAFLQQVFARRALRLA